MRNISARLFYRRFARASIKIWSAAESIDGFSLSFAAAFQ
jgi:hypothetical protein